VKFIQGALWSLVLASAALAQTMPNCSFEPWVSTGGASALTVCSSTAICPTGNSPNASAAGGIALVGFGVPYACLTSNVEYIVRTADISTGHHYSLGIVCHSGDCTPGTLYVQTGSLSSGSGAQAFTPSGQVTVSKVWQPAAGCPTLPCALPAGIYALAIGSDCTSGCAILYGDSNTGAFYAFNVSDTARDTPWAFDPVAGLPQSFSNMPAVQPTTLSAVPVQARPPTVLIY
jgi:hypothetical protein